jgi:sterol 3beta-glucosyltransferase
VKVFLSTLGSAGDIVTFARLADLLAGRGHSVTVHTWPHYHRWFSDRVQTLATAHSVNADQLHTTLAQALAMPTPWDQIRHFATRFYGIDQGDDRARQTFEVTSDAAAGHDLAVCNVLDLWGQAAVTKLGLPWFSWGSRPPPSAADTDGPEALGPLDAELQAWIRTAIGLEMPHFRTFRTRSPHGDLAACSPALSPSDAVDHQLTLTGAWLDPSPTVPLSPGLAAFVDAGPTLLITFGTLPDSDDRTEHLIRAAQAARWRVVAQVLPPSKAPVSRDGLYVVRGRVHYPTLLSRISAVVHHGGAGTLHEIVRAGKPSVAMPHISDQYFWAHAAFKLGLGPVPLGAHERNLETLRARLAALRHRRYTLAAKALAPVLAAEDGAMTTVRTLEAHARF